MTEQDHIKTKAAAYAMLAALEQTLSPLIILGDHIGNVFPGGNGQPAFDRCKIIGQIREAIESAHAAGVK